MFLTNQNAEEAQVVACILLFRKRATSRIWKVFFPIWEKNGGVLSMRMPARVQALLGAGRKESSGTGLKSDFMLKPRYKLYEDTNG